MAMTPKDFRIALDALGITQARFGRLMKVNKDTPTNWTKGRTEIPGCVVVVVKLLQAGRVTMDELETL